MNPIKMNQNCAEVMLINAVQLVLGQKIEFRYETDVADVQIDLGPAFIYSPDEEKIFTHNKNEIEQLLTQQLTQKKIYLLRTGTNGGAGHWQMLYYDKNLNGWINYSTETNQRQLTKNGMLTDEGKDMISPNKWGPNQGEYSLLFVEASQSNLINAANYLYDCRVSTPEQALNALALHGEARSNFYDSIYPQEQNEDNVFNSTIHSELNASKQALIKLLDKYLEQRMKIRDSHQHVKEYFYGRFFAIFQKSHTEKSLAVHALKAALNGENANLSMHLSTLRNGRLGKELRTFIKEGKADVIIGERVRTITDFVHALKTPPKMNPN